MNARKLNGCLLWLFVLALVVAAGLWATFESYKDYYAHVRPPVTGGTGENDLAAFLAAHSHSEPERVFLEGEECVLHFGHVPDRWSTRIVLPSGPPAYVFDRFGRLKKWFPDTGEGDFEAWYRTATQSPAAPNPHAETAEPDPHAKSAESAESPAGRAPSRPEGGSGEAEPPPSVAPPPAP